jgi:hypothetical protein
MTQSAGAGVSAARIDYDGRRFGSVGAHEADDSGDPAIGHYHQDGDLIWARFTGGGTRAGWLVGTCRPDGVIDAAYCMVKGDSDAIAGRCESVPTLLEDGRVRLTEHWRRVDGETGISEIEEIAE